MKNFSRVRRGLYRWSGVLEILGTSSAIALGMVLEIDTESAWLETRPIVMRMLSFFDDNALILYAVTISVAVLGTIIRKSGEPWVWDKIQFILDQYQSRIFDSEDPQDYHRVTLFKRKRCCLLQRHWSAKSFLWPSGKVAPFSDFLVPVCRSGHISQKSSAAFHITDDSDKSEGVAGKVWSTGKALVFNNLPDMNKAKPGITKRRAYAQITNSDLDMVDKYIADGRSMPRSLAAIPVEVYGEPWGVVVLDSRHENGVTEHSVVNYQLTVALIGQLLEKA